MTMMRAPVTGSTGASTNTLFFGPLPDRFNMLFPAHPTNSVIQPILTTPRYTSSVPANLIKNWIIWNPIFGGGSNSPTLTFGASSAAPDGTNDGIKIVESSDGSPTQHYITAGSLDWLNSSSNLTVATGLYPIRLAFFAQAAERTRITAYIATDTANNGGGCATTFDLAGVQVGVANHFFNPSGFVTAPAFGPNGATISAYGGGWCLCTMDVFVGTNNNNIVVALLPDAGSGTAAENTSYTGDGTSGVFVWRSTLMPPSAFANFNSAVFFSDFLSPSEVDINNTQAPGFKWYAAGASSWPRFGFSSFYPVTSPSIISVANSMLTLSCRNVNIQEGNLGTASYTGVGNPPWVGQVFQPPMLIEYKGSSSDPVPGQSLPSQAGSDNAFWSYSVEALTNPVSPPTVTPNAKLLSFEQDFYEIIYNVSQIPNTGFLQQNAHGTGDVTGGFAWASMAHFADYSSLQTYQGGTVILHGGLTYTFAGGPTPSPPPAAPWTLLDLSTLNPPSPQMVANIPTTLISYGDPTNVYSILWLPDRTLTFFDGIFNNQIFYDYRQGSSYQGSMSAHFEIFLGCQSPAFPVTVDWVRISI